MEDRKEIKVLESLEPKPELPSRPGDASLERIRGGIYPRLEVYCTYKEWLQAESLINKE